MKKVNFLIILIILCLTLFFLNECSNSKRQREPSVLNMENEETQTSYSEKFQITLPSFITKSMNVNIQGYVNTWETMIEETYNIHINLNHIYLEDYNAYLTNFVSEINGLYLINYSDYFEISKKVDVYNIGELLKDNETWNNLPDYFKNSLIYKGEIIAIPNSYYFGNNLYIRYVKNEAFYGLSETEMSLNDFYLFCLSKKSSNVLCIEGEEIKQYYDIYNSFGIPVRDNKSVIWNNESHKFEDIMFDANIEDCILWLQNAYLKNIINPNENQKYEMGSFLMISDVSYRYRNDYNTINLLTNDGYKSCKPALDFAVNGYSINKINSYEDAKIMANKFVNLFYGSHQGNMIGRYGILGDLSDEFSNFRLENDEVKIYYEDRKGSIFVKPNINILLNESNYTTNDFPKTGEILNSKNMIEINEYLDYSYEFKINLIETIKESIIPTRNIGFYDSNSQKNHFAEEIYSKANDITISIILGETDIDDALFEYRVFYDKLGVERLYLNEINSFFKINTQQ